MVLLCVGWEQKVTGFDYILMREKMSLALLSSQAGCFVFFAVCREKIAQSICPTV